MTNAAQKLAQTLNKVATIVAVKTIKGTSFVGVRNYLNKQGELSNQTFVVGISYANLLKNDLEKLKKFDLAKLLNEYKGNEETVSKAYSELLTSLAKRTATEEEKELLREMNDSTMNRSDAQTEAYNHIAKGLKEKDNQLYIYGLCVKKTVLVNGEYPQTKSQLKTIIKNKIKKAAGLQETKYKQFKLGEFEELHIQGISI